MSDLRARQRAVARQAIVDATAELVNERRHLDFSMKEIAERAGVSLRTLYNYFPDRADLLDALGEEFSVRTQASGMPEAESLGGDSDLASIIRRNVRAFEELGGVSEAFAQMPLRDVGRDGERKARTAMIVDHLASRMPETPDEVAIPIAVVLRHLISHRSWFWLTREYGLSSDEAADVMCWAVDTLTAAAEAGGRPERSET